MMWNMLVRKYTKITFTCVLQHIQEMEQYILWCLWWVGLGVLSSVGLGTGLHTFLLYLGPHIAAVTMAAYECGKAFKVESNPERNPKEKCPSNF